MVQYRTAQEKDWKRRNAAETDDESHAFHESERAGSLTRLSGVEVGKTEQIRAQSISVCRRALLACSPQKAQTGIHFLKHGSMAGLLGCSSSQFESVPRLSHG